MVTPWSMKPILRDPSLLRETAYHSGLWAGSATGAMREVLDPADGTVVGRVPELTAEETEAALHHAAAAMESWKREPASKRSAILVRWHSLLVDHAADLAAILTAEQGKPISEALAEVAYGADYVAWFAGEALRINGEVLQAPSPDKRIVVLKQPVGLSAAITPWNFPIAMVTRKVAPALAAGCAMVVKPAPQTPLSCLAIAELALRAGLPAGLFSVVTGEASVSGPVLSTHPLIRKLSFTGSTEVGKLLIAQASGTVKKVTMELGGNAPFLVFEDADLEAAVSGLMASKFRASGQTCICANRILIHESIREPFTALLKEAVTGLRLGHGTEEGVTQGPLIDRDALQKVDLLVRDAVSKGARVLLGGKPHALGGTFYEPTILEGCTPAMDLWHEEIFGPVVAISSFKTEGEAVAMANDTRVGLASYVYTRDMNRFWRVGEALEYGMVGVNTGAISNASAPFGGIKESGYGREGSSHGIDDYLTLKYLCLGGVR
jgi:succinate-semialdehyde dehydrogenase/glutarate-semialdehyde dehydrogenase